ncbi:hypothetical protein GCM10011360_27800 [Primorskyibacter flagellatus]|uniref:Uncharacterized protein n=1 Tax=Primorskyibacter flagellatus TaxID=1387277 RepID=A0A917EH10_9RHOB|nr:hypothetical protein GCM10011360_27800 [Primorskyibacter flagellatus]
MTWTHLTANSSQAPMAAKSYISVLLSRFRNYIRVPAMVHRARQTLARARSGPIYIAEQLHKNGDRDGPATAAG